MFNYKRLTFIFLLLSLTLVVTDSSLEKQARKSLLSLGNIVAEEGGQVTENAPSSFLDSMENGRVGLYNFLDTQSQNASIKAVLNQGTVNVVYNIVFYILLFLKFITNYVITFYPFILFLLYTFFTSRFFRREEFSYNNY